MYGRRWAFFVAASLAVAGSAFASPSGGTIFVTDHAMDPKSETFEKDLKKSAKNVLDQSSPENWHVYFVAYLTKAAGSEELNLVFYEIGKKEQPNAFPIQTQAKAKIVMADLEIGKAQDFKVGQKYDVRLTRLINGKEVVYAKTTLELK